MKTAYEVCRVTSHTWIEGVCADCGTTQVEKLKEISKFVWCEVCGKREAWSKNLKYPICAACAVLAWQKLSEYAKLEEKKLVEDLCKHGKGHCQCDNPRCRNYCD